MATILFLTDQQARDYCGADEQWDADGVDHGVGTLSQQVLQRLSELHHYLNASAVVRVMRDWEGCLVAVTDDAGAPFDVLALTDRGAVGHGGVNQPRYFDDIGAMLEFGGRS